MNVRYLLIVTAFISLNALADDATYETYGVHNSPDVSPCASKNCVYKRGEGEPSDPIYPEYWISDWAMYVVSKNYEKFPPPYQGKPPVGLKEGLDYHTSYGTTYYDSTWKDPSSGKQEGAMMEHYVERCLPIFAIENSYTCSFISLGDTAFFIAGKGKPSWMPDICLFSNFNHPPRRNFIEHLPYSSGDSERIGDGGQAYSFWVDHKTGKPIQTGVVPGRTEDMAIMFGYGFQKIGGVVQPQSFYFSGYPLPPANAPIVSQNYTDFRSEQPDPEDTWALVSNLDPSSLEKCQLFNPPQALKMQLGEQQWAPTWADIGRAKKHSIPNEKAE
ncbi:MAG: hypothetical protein ACJAZT_001573 [Gammaproteobacteria bacterium]|jgi:hypothetical protein